MKIVIFNHIKFRSEFSKIIKYLYTENYKILMKEITKYADEWIRLVFMD